MAFNFRRRASRSYEIDMCNGPLLSKIILFSFPLMVSSMLQLFFNAADIIVVGRYAGPTALAAVGSTGPLINLMVNLFMGLSIGTNVMVARYYGAQQLDDLEDTVHTSVTSSILLGTGLIFLGVLLSRPLLTLMGSPEDVIDQSALYIRIYFLSMPAMMLYNYGAAILRAVGDTKRPLYYLAVAGVLNVIINLILVIGFDMGVAGVAIATVISQYVSAFLIFLCLMKSNGVYRVDPKKLKITGSKFLEMTRIGLPAGIQGSVFSLSNAVIQSSINSFGSVAMAGSTAAANLEGFVYVAMNSFHQGALSFTSQNLGAKKYSRINKIMLLCLGCVTVTGLVLGLGGYAFKDTLLGIYTSDPAVIKYGEIRLLFICAPYFICGIMDVMVGMLRGLGYSITPMIVSIAGACGLRILWIMTVFQWCRTLEVLYLSYVISWLITGATHFVCYAVVKHKLPKKDGEPMPMKS